MPQDPALQFVNNAWAAMLAGDLEKLEVLTDLSPFPCASDGWSDMRWLTHAINSGNADAVIWVLSKGCDASYIKDDGNTPLKAVLQTEEDWPHSGNPVITTTEKAADLTIRLIDLLLAAGADINQRLSRDQTALHVAAVRSSPRLVRHLLDLVLILSPATATLPQDCRLMWPRMHSDGRWPPSCAQQWGSRRRVCRFQRQMVKAESKRGRTDAPLSL